jgi:transcriptional regulator of heat shock response
MLGFLIDEDEFEVSPAVTRLLQVLEVDTRTSRRRVRQTSNIDNAPNEVLFVIGNDTISQVFNYITDIKILDTENIKDYDVYINNNYYGTNISEIQLNTNDVLKFIVVKEDDNLESKILLYGVLI